MKEKKKQVTKIAAGKIRDYLLIVGQIWWSDKQNIVSIKITDRFEIISIAALNKQVALWVN